MQGVDKAVAVRQYQVTYEVILNTSPVSQLLKRLSQVGVGPVFARRAFPAWWDDDVAATPAGFQQACLYLSRAFNVELSSLAAEGAQIQFRQAQSKFKLSRAVSQQDVQISAQYVTAIARIALSAIDSQIPPPPDPEGMRQACLVNHRSVDLDALLAWCVKSSIPVLHVSDLPGKKMTGQVVRAGGKYAIVLTRQGCASEMLFWLAHELGHIARGHLSSDGFVTDQSIGSVNSDAEENEADSFAIRLLNGGPTAYRTGLYTTAAELAQAAIAKGNSERIDPGHIVLNCAHHMKRFPLGKAALNFLPNQNNASEKINAVWFQSVDEDDLSGDERTILARACGFPVVA